MNELNFEQLQEVNGGNPGAIAYWGFKKLVGNRIANALVGGPVEVQAPTRIPAYDLGDFPQISVNCG